MEENMVQWMKQAEADLLSSEHAISSKDYYVSAFLSQQAVEKSLKALGIKERQELIKSHSVSKLAKDNNLPEELVKKIALLEPVYQETRYPDISSTIPAEEFDETDAAQFYNIAEEVIEWIRKKIQ